MYAKQHFTAEYVTMDVFTLYGVRYHGVCQWYLKLELVALLYN